MRKHLCFILLVLSFVGGFVNLRAQTLQIICLEPDKNPLCVVGGSTVWYKAVMSDGSPVTSACTWTDPVGWGRQTLPKPPYYDSIQFRVPVNSIDAQIQVQTAAGNIAYFHAKTIRSATPVSRFYSPGKTFCEGKPYSFGVNAYPNATTDFGAAVNYVWNVYKVGGYVPINLYKKEGPDSTYQQSFLNLGDVNDISPGCYVDVRPYTCDLTPIVGSSTPAVKFPIDTFYSKTISVLDGSVNLLRYVNDKQSFHHR